MFARISNAILYHAAAYQSREQGQTMAEYGLILGLVAILCVAAFSALQVGIGGAITNVAAKF